MYDPIETLNWMLAEARAALAEPDLIDPSRPDARPRPKTKGRKVEEAVRVDVLTEALWNIAGRPHELPEYAASLHPERSLAH